ncbi:MAG: ferrous iron transport protein B [Bacteroidetes bacterium]|nr:ferrous iron transport protein B [Bacteroidota bacterium]MCL2302831.1 ferrous iron transport protein B [Lentimicrobiaceae bacterium]
MQHSSRFYKKLSGTFTFLFFIWLMFFCTFTLGKYPQEGILWLLERLNQFLATILPPGMLYGFISNGVVNGVGSVLAFLPNILILFFFMYMFEESNYLTHVAELLDHLMHKIGLHGNSVVPLLMGFGCNVPAILATKTIPDTKRKILTMLLIPFMSCSARLPILVLLVGTFFPQYPLLVIFGLYAFTIIMAIITAILLDRLFFKMPIDLTPVEVLPLQKPKLKRVLLLTWNAGYEYLKKIGTVVLIAMMAIWFLSNFPQNDAIQANNQIAYQYFAESNTDSFQDNTYLARFGRFIEPALRPLGFDWKMSVCLTTGLAAKEFIVGTMAILYHAGEDDLENPHIGTHLKNSGAFTIPVALSFLVFAMLYMPCVATIYAIRRESGSWKWALFSVVYSIALAWIISFVVFRVANFVF